MTHFPVRSSCPIIHIANAPLRKVDNLLFPTTRVPQFVGRKVKLQEGEDTNSLDKRIKVARRLKTDIN
jgi:hypothetical protein